MPGPSKNSELIKAADDFAALVKQYDGDRSTQLNLLRQADRLRILLESPLDTIFRTNESCNVIAALHLLIETETLEKIPAEGPITTKELSTLVGIDESAIELARALRLTVMDGIGVETEPNTFAHNEKSRAYLRGGAVDFFRICMEQMQAFIKLPEYLKTHAQEDLYDLKKSPFAYAFGLEGLTYYEAISHTPERLNMFNMTMTQMEKSVPFLGMFPFTTLKAEVEADTSRPFIVDIGGGRGQSLIAIQKEAPGGFGAKMILQDRPDVLDTLTPEDIPNIEKMPYDFFTPQPVKNAHVYFLRRVLHDFYEPVCIQILKNTATAMGPTSRLIVADMIIPERTEMGGDMTIYWMDFSMMMLNGKEKSKKEFEEILDAAGLEIVKIWSCTFGSQAQIECRLKNLDRTWIDFDLVLSEAGKDQFSLPQPHIEIEFNTMQVTERKIW